MYKINPKYRGCITSVSNGDNIVLQEDDIISIGKDGKKVVVRAATTTDLQEIYERTDLSLAGKKIHLVLKENDSNISTERNVQSKDKSSRTKTGKKTSNI